MSEEEYTNLRLFYTASSKLNGKTYSTYTVTSTSTSTLGAAASSKTTVRVTRPAAVPTSSIPTTLRSSFLSSSSTSQSSVPSETSETAVPSSTLQPLNVLSSNSLNPGKSLELGLAIGIPLALAAIIGGVLGFWYYMKKRGPKPEKMLTLNNQFYDLKSFDNPYDKVKSESSLTLGKEMYSQIPPNNALKTPIRFKDLPNRIQTSSKNLMKRFSTSVKIENVNNSISPLFLKRFNLNKPNTPSTPELQSKLGEGRDKKLPKLPPLLNEISFNNLEKPVEDDLFKVIKSYQKKLSDEISIDIGERVMLIKNHEDGWCTVQKLATKEVGVIPRLCLIRNT